MVMPHWTNCVRCHDVVRRSEVDAHNVCTLCRDQGRWDRIIGEVRKLLTYNIFERR